MILFMYQAILVNFPQIHFFTMYFVMNDKKIGNFMEVRDSQISNTEILTDLLPKLVEI